jgi:hypothetical protein
MQNSYCDHRNFDLVSTNLSPKGSHELHVFSVLTKGRDGHILLILGIRRYSRKETIFNLSSFITTWRMKSDVILYR